MFSRITVIALAISLILSSSIDAGPLRRMFSNRRSTVQAPATSDPTCTGPNCGPLSIGPNNSINTPANWQPANVAPYAMPSMAPQNGSVTLQTAAPLPQVPPAATMAPRATTAPMVRSIVVKNSKDDVITKLEKRIALLESGITPREARIQELKSELAKLEGSSSQPYQPQQPVESQSVDVNVGGKKLRLQLNAVELPPESKNDSISDVVNSFPILRMQHINSLGYVEFSADLDMVQVVKEAVASTVKSKEPTPAEAQE